MLVTVHSGMLTLPIGSYYPCCPPIVTVVNQEDTSNLCLKHGFPFFKLVPLHSRNWVALLTSWYHLAAVC